jgi:CheY-like chemotaxis protein
MGVRIDELAPKRHVAPLKGDAPAATRVLVVEDEPVPRRLLHDLLAMHGYDVLEASNGAEGLERLREATPDLILLDLNMPVMDGWQFRAAQRRLKDLHLATTPVLLMTGAESAAADAAMLSVEGLVEKPFHPDRLLGAIEAALRH